MPFYVGYVRHTQKFGYYLNMPMMACCSVYQGDSLFMSLIRKLSCVSHQAPPAWQQTLLSPIISFVLATVPGVFSFTRSMMLVLCDHISVNRHRSLNLRGATYMNLCAPSKRRLPLPSYLKILPASSMHRLKANKVTKRMT